MVIEYRKGSRQKLSVNFDLSEFDCHCARATCETTLVDLDLIRSLEDLRLLSGAIAVDDGFRCSEHNLEVGGAPNSQHLLGKAADVRTKLTPEEMVPLAERVRRFLSGGIGLYPAFVHLDVRGRKARWSHGYPH